MECSVNEDAEYLRYMHPHFQRDQPGMIFPKMSAKSKAKLSNTRAVLDLGLESDTENVPPCKEEEAVSIAALKHTQSLLSDDITNLRKEIREARNNQANLQDKVNRIVQFLAGVFSGETGSNSSTKPGPGPWKGNTTEGRRMIGYENENFRASIVQHDSEDVMSKRCFSHFVTCCDSDVVLISKPGNLFG